MRHAILHPSHKAADTKQPWIVGEFYDSFRLPPAGGHAAFIPCSVNRPSSPTADDFLTKQDSRSPRDALFLIIGPPRSGKGTISHVLRRIVGPANVASPTLSSLTENFGLQSLIGKRLALIADARMSAKVDQGTIVERILSITGEDTSFMR